MQRRAFDECGGWPAPFWYAHEGIELAWRVWDAGYIVWYMGDLAVAHPVIDPRRHDEYFYMTRPEPRLVGQAKSSLAVQLGIRRFVDPDAMHQVGEQAAPAQGLDGRVASRLATRPHGARDEDRRKLSGRGVLRMSRHGRPPIV
jgi:hypothetical protein